MGLFNMENPVWQTMGRVADIMILSLLWMFCSIPIVTMGASTTALYYVTLKIAEKREGYVVRGFFKSFKENFLQATGIWLLMLVGFVIVIFDIRFFGMQEGTAATIAQGIFFAMLIFLLIINLYIYPVLARFVNTIRKTFINTAIMAFGSPLYLLWSLAMMAATLIAVWFIPALVILAPGIMAYATSFPISRVIAKYMPPEEDEMETEE